MSNLRVLLADDHIVVREGLRALIEAQPDIDVIGEAGDGHEAWKLSMDLGPDVVVMDISMPEMGGAAATRLIRRDCPETRVLALTVHEVLGYIRQMLEAGASGYVLKRAATDELVRAIRSVASGERYIDPRLADQLQSDGAGRENVGHPDPVVLTEREAEIARLLSRGHINREIADALQLSIKTVEVYKARTLAKLGLRSRADLVRYAMDRGWLHES
ncbi:response regulator [Tundrisphaera sp. TA3]|uniref:response regulator n=1 Tax=Tundrisphaera sp. TA3 TaxID=3435775 RepID=UPI003EB79E2D